MEIVIQVIDYRIYKLYPSYLLHPSSHGCSSWIGYDITVQLWCDGRKLLNTSCLEAAWLWPCTCSACEPSLHRSEIFVLLQIRMCKKKTKGSNCGCLHAWWSDESCSISASKNSRTSLDGRVRAWPFARSQQSDGHYLRFSSEVSQVHWAVPTPPGGHIHPDP